jgi:DNA-binding XRE family transcriptional regulator
MPTGYNNIIGPVGLIDKANWLHFSAFSGGEAMSAEWFAGRLRELRGEARLTQGQLAERAGVKRDAVARWERGTREPSWSNVLALADALAVSTEAFRQEPGPAPPPQPGRPPRAPAGAPRRAKKGRPRRGK